MTIKTQSDALKAMQILHDKGPTTVVLSSTSLGAEGVLLGLASSVKSKLYSSTYRSLYRHGVCCVAVSCQTDGAGNQLERGNIVTY